MASIELPKLTIKVIPNTETAECVVTCNVRFSRYEMSQIQLGLRFKLSCKLWERDIVTPDDYLYGFGDQIFPDTTPTTLESVTFRQILGLSLLNQEWGTDEIYGRLELKNLYTRDSVPANTNVVKRRF
jgi:hypothetical protein